MRKSFWVLLFFGFYFSVFSQNGEPQILKIWEDTPPTFNGLTDEAEIIVYRPQTISDTPIPAVLIFPGGGYAGVSMPYEGHATAKWMASQGVVGIILKYRLPNQHKDVPFEDACKALQIINDHASDWNIDTSKIGLVGFSAGGHLAAVLSTYYADNHLCLRPAFTILFYPVTTFETLTKGGTRNNLMGLEPSGSEIFTYSAEKQVSENTTPTIIFTANDDNSVPSTFSSNYYNALKRNNVPASLYIFPKGGHGWGFLPEYKYNEQALSLLKDWIDDYVK